METAKSVSRSQFPVPSCGAAAVATFERFEDIETWLSNFAEGFERGGKREFCDLLAIARGFGGTVKSQMCVALDRHYVDSGESTHFWPRVRSRQDEPGTRATPAEQRLSTTEIALTGPNSLPMTLGTAN